jgi:glutamate synthase (NADPH) small chain
MEQTELRLLEDLCIQEHAPPCAAVCPVHVNVRGMIAEIAQGDFSAALSIFQKSVPFPSIICRICDQPCRIACNRKDAGEAIEIVALERACVELGAPGKPAKPLPKRDKRVAVVGAGLSGMTTAYELGKKGYGVVMFDAAVAPGGKLWQMPEERLPRSVINTDTEVLGHMGVELRLNTRLASDISLAGLLAEFDAVYLGLGADAAVSSDLERDDASRVKVDPLTFATSQARVFAGGSMLRAQGGYSPIQSLSEGRRAATSIDRLLQGASLSAARQNEGSYQTRLYTDLETVAPLPAVVPSNPTVGYCAEEAIAEAQRCIQCECMECIKVCEYLRHYGSYPKRYVREVYNNLSIVMGTRHANRFTNSCSLCGLCAEVCPNDLDMAAVCSDARRLMVQQGKMPPSAHDFALRDMAFSNSSKFATARNQPGTASSTYLFFPGCQLAGSSPAYVEQLYAYLTKRLDGGVGLMLRCCGAPADWAGRDDLLQDAVADLKATHREMGNPTVLLACSSCYSVFKKHLPDVEIVSLWQKMDELGLPSDSKAKSTDNLVVSVHDPCTTRYESDIHDSARNIITQLGYTIEELPMSREKTECCSFGGLMWFANRELAQDVIRRRISESNADYVTYCAMCRDFFASQGKRTLHILDLMFGDDIQTLAERDNPGYSLRHENRARLKRKLLQELWGEEMPDREEYEAIVLEIAPDVAELMEDRLILIEDVQRVIGTAEKTGRRLLNPDTGHFLAHYRPTAVTYWVEYSPKGEAFVIHNAYSHRMEIAEAQE